MSQEALFLPLAPVFCSLNPFVVHLFVLFVASLSLPSYLILENRLCCVSPAPDRLSTSVYTLQLMSCFLTTLIQRVFCQATRGWEIPLCPYYSTNCNKPGEKGLSPDFKTLSWQFPSVVNSRAWLSHMIWSHSWRYPCMLF